MKKTDKLFELLQTLTMSEKRYFKVFASRHTIGKQNNYIILFDLMEKMTEYDAQALAQKLEEQDISSKHISSDKNYLYNLILRSLSSYYTGKSARLQVKELLHQIELLYNRELPHHSLKLIRKASNLAEASSLFGLLEIIYEWEGKVLIALQDFDSYESLLERRAKNLELINNKAAYTALLQQVRKARREIGHIRCEEGENRVQALKEHSLLQQQAYLSLPAQLYHWQILGEIEELLGHTDQATASFQQALDLLADQEALKEEYPLEHLDLMTQMLFHQSGSLDQETFEARCKNLKKGVGEGNGQHIQLKTLVEIRILWLHMDRALKQGKLSEAKTFIDPLSRLLEGPIRLSAGEFSTYYYTFTYVLMRLEDYRACLPFTNALINEYDDHSRPDLHGYIRLLNLVVHYQLGNHRLLRYLTDSTQRYLKKHNRYFKVEAELLRLFRKLANQPDSSQEQRLFKASLSKVETIMQDHPLEAGINCYFEVDKWLQRLSVQEEEYLPS